MAQVPFPHSIYLEEPSEDGPVFEGYVRTFQVDSLAHRVTLTRKIEDALQLDLKQANGLIAFLGGKYKKTSSHSKRLKVDLRGQK